MIRSKAGAGARVEKSGPFTGLSAFVAFIGVVGKAVSASYALRDHLHTPLLPVKYFLLAHSLYCEHFVEPPRIADVRGYL